tara:strand:- start:1538 stop:2047 length:510 start_codon:yes stop_codon:yes gene_type:complete
MVAIYSAYIVFASPKTGEPVYWKLSKNQRIISQYVVDKPYQDSSVCAIYFRLKKRDDGGFTPETMEWNIAKGELSIIGKQEGKSSSASKTIQRKFKVGSFSPRIASLYKSKDNFESDENARLKVGEIIVDTEMTQPNIIEYVNSQDEIDEIIDDDFIDKVFNEDSEYND